MKRIVKSFALLAVAASALVSCKGELTTPEEKPQTGKFEYTFTLGAPETKALLASDSEGYFAQWEVGDKLGIYTLNNAAETTNNTAADIDISKNPVEFKVVTSYALDERSEVYAYFPYDANNSTVAEEDPSAVVLSIPASQTGSLNAMPMAAKPYAVTEPISVGIKPIADIKMRNLGSILNFNVYSSVEAYRTETVSSIAFTTETPLCGSFTYDIMEAELADITGYEGTTVTVTKNITPGNDKASGNTVPMVVAPNATAGYTGTIVVTTNVATYTYTISSGIKIDRSIIKKVNVDLGSANAVRELIAPESPVYTLAFTQQDNTSPYNSYTAEHSYTCDGVEWKIFGNQAQGEYLRFGGQNTTATNRTITSAGVISGEVTYVVMNHDGIKNGSNTTMTINSMSIKVSSSPSFPENDTEVITINNPDLSTGELNFEFDDSHENSYYQVVMNYQVSASGSARNSYLWLNNVEFFTGVVAPKYDITISNEITNGSVTAAPSRAKAGATVLLTATPNDGYDFTSYNVMCGDNPVSVANDGTFTMPEGNVVVNAVFTEKTKYNVNLSQTTGGTISSDLTQAWAGQIVTLTKELTSGYAFKAWNVKYGVGNTPVEVAEDKFTMPAAAVTASAVFIPTLTVSPMKPTKKESTAGSWDFTVTTIATDWEVSVPNDQDWATVEKVGAGFRINYTANELETESTDDRSVVISVTSAQAEKTGDQAIQITFSQSGKEYIAPGTGYVRVSNVSDLAAGMTVVFGCASNNAAAGAIAVISGSVKDYLLKEDANIVDNILMSNSAKEYVLGGSTDAWTFTSDEGQLGSIAPKKLTVNTEANNYVGTWKISIDGDGNAKITSTTAANGSIQYNATSGQERFLNYATDQTAIQIYTIDDGKSSRNVNFTASEATADMWNGKSTSVLGLTGDAEGDKTYSSSDETVATINNAGVISLKKVGETRITVEIAATETFRKGTAYYTLRVVDNTPVLTLNTSSVDVAASAAANATIPGAYSLSNAVDGDVSVSKDGNITAASVAAGTVTYSISENTLESPVASHITLTLNAIPYTITVNQAGAGKTSLSAPGAITVGTKKPTSISASWTAPSSTTGITGYEWIISTASTSSAAESSYVYKGSVSGSSTLTFTKDGTFTTGTTYYVYVRSVGNEATTTPSSYVRSDSFQVKAAQTYSSTFNSKSWGVATGGTISWTNDKEAFAYTNPNVQVTAGLSGAGATTTNSYTNITKIRIKALTTKSGVGNITVKVGTGAAQQICSLSKNQTATFYELTFDTPVSGKVTFVVNCSTNSMYVQAAEIIAD